MQISAMKCHCFMFFNSSDVKYDRAADIAK